ncbi:hypothetical protein D3C72_1552360 [compost metagenome]
MAARLGRRHEALGEGGEGLQRHARDHGLAGLFPALGLAAEGVELAVGGQDAHRLLLDPGHEADQQVVGVGGEDQAVGRRQVQLLRHMLLRLGDDLAEDQLPLAVGEAVGLGPGLDLGVEAGVGPQVMAVGGEMQAFRVKAERARKEGLVAHGAKLAGGGGGVTSSAHTPSSSGLTRGSGQAACVTMERSSAPLRWILGSSPRMTAGREQAAKEKGGPLSRTRLLILRSSCRGSA